jgi:hypothetical protein
MYYLTFLTGFNINWSEDLFSFIRATNRYASIVPSDSINYSCILIYIVDHEDLFLGKNVVLTFTPILMILLCIFFRCLMEGVYIVLAYLLMKKKKLTLEKYKTMTHRSELKNKFFTRLISVTIVIFYNVYSRILVNTVKLLSCISIDNTSEKLFLEMNPDIECYSDEHKRYLYFIFIPNILVWCLGWPTLIYFVVTAKKSKSSENSFLKKFSQSLMAHGVNINEDQIRNFFVVDYRASAYYWELVFYAIGFFTAILQVTTSRLSTLSQGALLSGLYAIALLFTETKRPFQRGSMNSMNTLSYLIIIATLSFAVLTSMDKIDRTYQIIWLIGIYTANGCFYLYWLYLYLKIVGKEFYHRTKEGVKKTLGFFKSSLTKIKTKNT